MSEIEQLDFEVEEGVIVSCLRARLNEDGSMPEGLVKEVYQEMLNRYPHVEERIGEIVMQGKQPRVQMVESIVGVEIDESDDLIALIFMIGTGDIPEFLYLLPVGGQS